MADGFPAALAAFDQAWMTTAIFAAFALALALRKVVERSVAVGTVLTGLNVLKTMAEGDVVASSSEEKTSAEPKPVIHLVYRAESSNPKTSDSIYVEVEGNIRAALKKATQPSYVENYLEELQPAIKIKKARA